jgi:hypothetical protein
MLCPVFYCYAECHYTECCNAKCPGTMANFLYRVWFNRTVKEKLKQNFLTQDG